jgi:hypothetical protein
MKGLIVCHGSELDNLDGDESGDESEDEDTISLGISLQPLESLEEL